MTREEIMRLEGRELDAAVHERVFGRRVWWSEWESPDEPSFKFPLDPDMRIRIPHYSSDIAAAWQVVERMRETYFPEIRFGHGIDDRPDVWVIFHTSDHHCGHPCQQNGVSAPPDQVPTAICRAALLAVMGERLGDA